MVLFGIGYLTLARKPAPSAAVAIKAPTTPAATTAASSIAVLPLTNESGAASEQYFSDGISEDLINALSQFPGLKVIGRDSSFQFRNSQAGSRRIGAKLGVAHLLEGSVQKSGNMIRVSVELIDTADGSTQWSQQYDRAYKDLFALEDEITQAVANALKTRLLPGATGTRQDERPPSGSLAAYNALLQGRFYYDRETESDSRRAIHFFTEATRIDPQYALAWAELGRAWADFAAEFLEPAPAREAYARAREATSKALSLDPQLAFAHLAHGNVLEVADFDWRGAEAEYRQALALAPRDPESQFDLGNLLATIGKVQEAIALTREALGAEPLRARWYNSLAHYLSGVHRLDEAEKAIRKAIELQPMARGFHAELAIILIQRGEAAAALEAAQQEPAGGWQDVALALARQVGPHRGAADAALKRLIERDSGDAAYQIAQVYALRGDANATFHWLARAWSNRDGGIFLLRYDPFILRYKDDPRFAAFCRKVGLPVPGEVSAHTST